MQNIILNNFYDYTFKRLQKNSYLLNKDILRIFIYSTSRVKFNYVRDAYKALYLTNKFLIFTYKRVSYVYLQQQQPI